SKVVSAEFDPDIARWRVRTADGTTYLTRVLIPATGQLSQPVYPSIPGIDTFTGVSFHSARWNHDCDLSGKRVAVIGTGASAVQFVPFLQREAASVAVFQRSAPYVLPRRDRVYTPRLHRLDRKSVVYVKSVGLGGITFSDITHSII